MTSFVMGDRLPWARDGAVPPAPGPFDPSFVVAGTDRRPCAILSVSAQGATLRGDIAARAGDQFALELMTGQRPAGTIEWVDRGEAGFRFRQPIDMLALINRKLLSQPTERRSMPRVELRCAVRLKWAATVADVVLRNISAQGLQVEGDALPPRYTFVSVFIDGLVVPSGEVVWAKEKLAGIELLEELSWTSLMPWIRAAAAAR